MDISHICKIKGVHAPHNMGSYDTVNYGELQGFCLGTEGNTPNGYLHIVKGNYTVGSPDYPVKVEGIWWIAEPETSIEKLKEIISTHDWNDSVVPALMAGEEIVQVEEDFTQHEENLSSNGGAYGFWTEAHKIKSGLYRLIEKTTADVPFCPACGQFGNHDPKDWDYRTIDFRKEEEA